MKQNPANHALSTQFFQWERKDRWWILEFSSEILLTCDHLPTSLSLSLSLFVFLLDDLFYILFGRFN